MNDLREAAQNLDDIALHWHTYEIPQRKQLWKVADFLKTVAREMDALRAENNILRAEVLGE